MPDQEDPLQDTKDLHFTLLQKYAKIQPELDEAAKQVEALMEAIAKRVGAEALVRSRAKTVKSVSEKIIRGDNLKRHPEPFDKAVGLSDLIGVQVATYTRRDAELVIEEIKRLGDEFLKPNTMPGRRKGLEIDEVRSCDTSTRLRATEFGYTARHFIIRIHGSKVPGYDTRVGKASAEGRAMEIQVSTILSWAWNIITHDRTYGPKVDLNVPPQIQRQVAEAKAMLDAAERTMEEAIVELDRYRKRGAGRLWEKHLNYLRTNDREKTKEVEPTEFEKAKIICDSVLKVGGDRVAMVDVQRTRAELALAEEDHQKAREVIKNALEAKPKTDPALAVLYAKVERLAGEDGAARERLEGYLNLYPENPSKADTTAFRDPTNAAAACLFVQLLVQDESVTQEDFDTAVKAAQPAFEHQPDDPELLAVYTTARLLASRDASCLSTMRGAFLAGAEECQKRLTLGSDLPECVLLQARLLLLAGDINDACNAYCLAFLHGPVEPRLVYEQRVLQLLRARLKRSNDATVQKLRVGLESAEALLQLLLHTRRGDKPKPPRKQVVKAFQDASSIVVVAGDTSQKYAATVRRVKGDLEAAFKKFPGVVISGGTKGGICEVVGNLKLEDSRKVAYFPEAIKRGNQVELHPDYDVEVPVKVTERGEPVFSPLAPIRMWLDLLAAGIDLKQVRLLGVGGGGLSGFEYRLAITVGATAGLIEGTGRAASELLEDPHWKGRRGLARLIHDHETLRLFVNVVAEATVPLDDEIVEQLAAMMHADYQANSSNKPGYVHESMLSWDGKLDDIYKESNRHQVRGMQWILATEGFAIVPAEGEHDTGIDFGHDVTDKDGNVRREPRPECADAIERMARLEHARWNAERAALGWTRGEGRSLKQKTNPSIRPYDELDEETRSYDRNPYLKLAKSLGNLRRPPTDVDDEANEKFEPVYLKIADIEDKR